MQVVIPLAGKGTRMRPHSHLVPKPLLKVAGRPVLDWVMDALEGLEVEELIFVTGHLKEQVEAYVRRRYPVTSRFVEQKVQDGTAGAVHLARPFVRGPVLIIFVDTIFDADLSIVRSSTDDGIIWAKEVEDYRRFGVVVTDADGYMTRIVEKPAEPVSRLANIGLYYVRGTDGLFAGIDHVLSRPANGGEYYLTDAFQWMIERGARIRTAAVAGWYDCGTVATMLETNRVLLERSVAARGGGAGARGLGKEVTVVEPVYLEDGVRLERSSVGPYVAVESGTVIRGSRVENCIVGRDCLLEGVRLDGAMLGEGVVLRGGG